MRLFVSEPVQAKYLMPEFNSKWKYDKLAADIRVLQNAQKTAKKCTKMYNARARPLFYSFNLLFGGFHRNLRKLSITYFFLSNKREWLD